MPVRNVHDGIGILHLTRETLNICASQGLILALDGLEVGMPWPTKHLSLTD